ncbi:MAG: hypothetical protein ACXVPQ_00420 [Bacteroidia bacterium]
MFAKITKVFLIVSVLASAVSLGINCTGWAKITNANWWASVLFFLGTGLLINFILFKGKSDPRDFVFKIMFTSMLRLLLCMVGIFIYSLADKGHIVGFALHFMLHYILFTAFEIAYLLKFTKTQPQHPSS